jgi:ankyrin repeat protein
MKTRTSTNVALGFILTALGGYAAFAATAGVAEDSRLPDAAMRGDNAAVRSLLSQHADVNAAQPDGSTALFWAARADDREMAAFLISHGAAVNTANHYGITALSLAATNASAPMIEALLKAGADANTATPLGQTVLMTAARTGNPEAVKVLLDHGANVNAKESAEQETALMFAAAENHAEVVRLLIAHGADVGAHSRTLDPNAPRPSNVGNQSLHATFLDGGLTALLMASRQGAMESAQALVEGKADINQSDPAGFTPMIVAIMNAHFDLAAMLLEKGADPNAVDKTGRGALHAAVDMHRFEWMFSRPTPKASGKLDSADIAKLLLEKGANPNARLTKRVQGFQHDSRGNPNLTAGSTPFMKAASASDVAMMRLLIDHGADTNLTNDGNTTPLMVAAGLNWVDHASLGSESESIEAIQLCLDHGADVNATNKLGETALHGAAERGADSVVSFLVSKGAKLDAATKAGRTPLDEALGQAAVKDENDNRRPERVSTVALLRKLEQ